MNFRRPDIMIGVLRSGDVYVAQGASRSDLRRRSLVYEDELFYSQVAHRCIARGESGRLYTCSPSGVRHGDTIEYLFSQYDVGKYNIVGKVEVDE